MNLVKLIFWQNHMIEFADENKLIPFNKPVEKLADCYIETKLKRI